MAYEMCSSAWMSYVCSSDLDLAEVPALRLSQGIKALGGLVDGFIPLAATDVLSRLCLIEPTLPLLRAGLNHLLHDRFLRPRYQLPSNRHERLRILIGKPQFLEDRRCFGQHILIQRQALGRAPFISSEESREGKACVSTGRLRWS